MLAYTYVEKGKFELKEKEKPVLKDGQDAIVRVTMGSICAVIFISNTVRYRERFRELLLDMKWLELLEEIGKDVTAVKPGDRVTVNVETFCGECFFCQHGFVNNCVDANGGWALGCRIDGGQAEYVRVPYANQGLNRIPDGVTDAQALFVGDVLATGFWAAKISNIQKEDTVLIIGAGPTGICTLLCVMLKEPEHIIICEKDPQRIAFVREHYPNVCVATPEECEKMVQKYSRHGVQMLSWKLPERRKHSRWHGNVQDQMRL